MGRKVNWTVDSNVAIDKFKSHPAPGFPSILHISYVPFGLVHKNFGPPSGQGDLNLIPNHLSP